jgi:hypothetical protein
MRDGRTTSRAYRGSHSRWPRPARRSCDSIVLHLFTAGRRPHRPGPVRRGKSTLDGLGPHVPCDFGQYEVADGRRVHAAGREGACTRVVPCVRPSVPPSELPLPSAELLWSRTRCKALQYSCCRAFLAVVIAYWTSFERYVELRETRRQKDWFYLEVG